MPYADRQKQVEYQRQWVAKRRAEWLAENGPCVRCGSAESIEIDHKDAFEKVSHRIWSWSKEKRDAELAKCQVLCRPCHHTKTGEDNGWGMHGSSGYQRGCRCSLCTYGQAYRCRHGRSITFDPNTAIYVPTLYSDPGVA